MRDLSFGLAGGALELRAAADGGQRLSGRFPYNKRAVMSDGGRNGRPEKEEFAEHAFAYRVNDPEAEIYLLGGHRYDQPLASKLNGTLTLRDTTAALFFDALITPEVAQTTHARDVLLLLAAGLATGLSPGFRIPPKRAVPPEDAEEFIDEPNKPDEDMHAARIRRIKQALLYELSIVTQPAYEDAQVAAAEDAPARPALARPTPSRIVRPQSRWRP